MAELKYEPAQHNHAEFLAEARQRPGFNEAYDSLELEYTIAIQPLKARAEARIVQDAVASRAGATQTNNVAAAGVKQVVEH